MHPASASPLRFGRGNPERVATDMFGDRERLDRFRGGGGEQRLGVVRLLTELHVPVRRERRRRVQHLVGRDVDQSDRHHRRDRKGQPRNGADCGQPRPVTGGIDRKVRSEQRQLDGCGARVLPTPELTWPPGRSTTRPTMTCATNRAIAIVTSKTTTIPPTTTGTSTCSPGCTTAWRANPRGSIGDSGDRRQRSADAAGDGDREQHDCPRSDDVTTPGTERDQRRAAAALRSDMTCDRLGDDQR